MLARIAAFVEPKRGESGSAQKLTAAENKQPLILPEHLIALSIQTSVNHLRPAAVFVSSVTGSTARRLAAMHLPVPIIAVSGIQQTCQALQFSYGVMPVHVKTTPSSWSTWVSQWAKKSGLAGSFAILTEKVLTPDGCGNHRLEIINL